MNAYSSQWYPLESSDLSISGELSTETTPHSLPQRKSRKTERVPVELGAGLRQRGATGVSVRIMNLSTDGFRAATHLDLFPGTQVWLRLPGLEPCHAQVVWAEGHCLGCAFERPLHPAVLQMIIDKASRR